MEILPVILSGGAGSRLWPLSKHETPKQLLSLVTSNTMLQDTASRLAGLENVRRPLIICNDSHRFQVAEQLRAIDIEPEAIILEPIGRNTAPAIAMAALYAKQHFNDAILLVLPSDHVIADKNVFQQAVQQAAAYAEQGKLATFGIVPNAPETGYGYIRAGDPFADAAFHVAEFVEKPDLTTAKEYLASGNYYWNSGMFMFRATDYLRELNQHRADIFGASELAYSGITRDSDFCRLNAASFADCPSDSIDYAVMEKTQDAVVVPLAAGWSDVGSWAALADISESDLDGNVVLGDVITHAVSNSYLRSEGKLITAIGVENLVVVTTPNEVLVTTKDKCQQVKEMAAKAAKRNAK